MDFIQANIGGDAIEPILERSTAIKPVEPPPCADQSLLCGIFRIEKRSEHPVAMASNSSAMGLKMLEIGNCPHDIIVKEA
jgi:hypothetical protein